MLSRREYCSFLRDLPSHRTRQTACAVVSPRCQCSALSYPHCKLTTDEHKSPTLVKGNCPLSLLVRLVTTRLYENEAIQWRYTGIPFSLRRPYRTFKHQHSPSHRTRQTVGAVASPRCRCFASSCPGRCAASEACGARRPRGLRTTCEIMKNPINWLGNLTNTKLRNNRK